MQVNSNNTLLGREPYQKNRYVLKENSNYQTAFCAEQKQPETEQEKPDSKFGIKTATNVLGVAAWLFIVGYSMHNLKMLQKKHPETILRGLKDIKKTAKSYIENDMSKGQTIESALGAEKNKKSIKFFYNLGERFQNAKMKVGGELFNNLLYAFGTLVVMPAVVLLSPSKKEGTSKEDKFFTVLRQPLSVAATLGMQFTFDKLIDKYVPETLKQNKLEDKSILDSEGKIKIKDEKGNLLSENVKKIKYNIDSAKDGFKASIGKALSKEEIDGILELKSFEEEAADTFERKFQDVISQKYSKLGIKLEELSEKASKSNFLDQLKKMNPAEAKSMEDVFAKFQIMTDVVNNNKMAVQKSKTMVNVLFASIIGCTFLNVIYGKTMKGLKQQKLFEDKKNNEAKEVK